MKEQDNLSVLSKTLFIPLAVRANETANEKPLLTDKMAEKILNQCDTDHMTLDGGEISAHGILARTTIIDMEVKKLLAENPCATVINLGAGLDTRFFRLDNGRVLWYDLDLPEVISFRRKFISENERLHFISKSVLDHAWVNEIKRSETNTTVIIAEGLLMYFKESDVKEILNILAAAFPNADLFLDVVHSFFVGKGISSDFQWGIKRADEVVNLNQNIEVRQSWSTGNLLKERQSLAFRLLNILPSTRNRSQILHLKLKG